MSNEYQRGTAHQDYGKATRDRLQEVQWNSERPLTQYRCMLTTMRQLHATADNIDHHNASHERNIEKQIRVFDNRSQYVANSF